jgi:hypothetical protein
MADETKPLEGEVVNMSPPLQLTKQDENIVQVLEAAFNNGYNITEACQYANISRTIFYRWMAEDDAFSYRMSVAQTALNRKAKSNVMAAIQEGDPNISLRYLTLRDPDFKPKTVLEPPEGLQKTEDKLKEFMDDTDDGAYSDPANADSIEPTTTPPPESGEEVAPSPTDIS